MAQKKAVDLFIDTPEVNGGEQIDTESRMENEARKEHQSPPHDVITLDKKMFYRMYRALVTERATHYIGMSGLRLIGQMLGARTYEEERAEWEKAIKYLAEHQ